MSRRKKSNLKASQDANEARRLALIDDAFEEIKEEKSRYDDVTSLAKRVAGLVSSRERLDPTIKKPGISYTTLLRNARDGMPGPYRLQLELFLDGTFDLTKPKKLLSHKDLDAFIRKCPGLRPFIGEKDLEIGDLKNALEEKEQQLQRVRKHLQNPEVAQITEKAGQPKQDELKQANRDLTMTCTWIERFLRTLPFIQIDEKNEVILDLSKRGKPLVADKDLFEPFFKALKLRYYGEGQNG